MFFGRSGTTLALRDKQLLSGCPFAAHTTKKLSTEPLQLQASQHACGNIMHVDPTLYLQKYTFTIAVVYSIYSYTNFPTFSCKIS